MKIIELTADNFEEEVLNSKVPVLVDFWAEWCMPCRMMTPIVDDISEERDDIKVGKVNIDLQGELAMKYKVMSIPTFIVFENGKAVDKKVGAVSKDEIEEMI